MVVVMVLHAAATVNIGVALVSLESVVGKSVPTLVLGSLLRYSPSPKMRKVSAAAVMVGAYGCVAKSVPSVKESIRASGESIPTTLDLKKMWFLDFRVDSPIARIDSDFHREQGSCFNAFSTEKNFKVFRVDRIDSGTPRIDSYPSRDEISLPGLQGIDSQPSEIDSVPKYFKNWYFSGRHHWSDVYVSRSDSGGLRANVSAYDNSGLSDVVHDVGGLRTNVLVYRRYIRNKEETPNYTYMRKKEHRCSRQ
ncbi:hypothetical protein PIB30_064723 [Stylosanthes scabra]|uniref:Uncharacterized protein n=1 Tax=Stylosanthes scabra TaxID=79078 RepID=A0ABU6VMT9_9FABA|nr:hypothetical protein [Stylosanthes scabra]